MEGLDVTCLSQSGLGLQRAEWGTGKGGRAQQSRGRDAGRKGLRRRACGEGEGEDGGWWSPSGPQHEGTEYGVTSESQLKVEARPARGPHRM